MSEVKLSRRQRAQRAFQSALVLRSVVIGTVLFSLSAVLLAIASTVIGNDHQFEKFLVAGVASALLSASTAGLIDRVFLTRDVLAEVRTVLSTSKDLAPMAGYGLTRLGLRSDYEFGAIYDQAKTKVCVMGIGLPLMNDEPAAMALERRLAMDDPPSVRVLLLNPWSAASARRGRDTTYGEYEDYEEELITSVRRYWSIGRRLQQTLDLGRDIYDVRLYSSNPYVSLFIHDHCANFSFYLGGQRGASSVFFECADGPAPHSLYRGLEQHFETVWDASISVFDEELLQLLHDDREQTVRQLAAIDIERTLPARMRRDHDPEEGEHD